MALHLQSSIDRRRWVLFFTSSLGVILFFGLCYHLFRGVAGSEGLFLVVAVGMAAEALAVRSFVAVKARRNRSPKEALVIGAGWAGRQVIDTVQREPRLRTRIVGVIDDDLQKRNYVYREIPVVGNQSQLRDMVEKNGVELIITSISHLLNAELIKSLLDLKMQGVEIIDMPSFYERATGQIPIKHVDNSWFLYAGGFDILHRPLLQKVKRVLDVAVSLAALFLSLPLVGLIAFLIKVDSPGPVFFRQEHTGWNEKLFRLMRFRTLRAAAKNESGPIRSGVGDYRVTRVGRWLRMTRLDEIPQFLNVLRGEMSFVGPRPERHFFVERLKRIIPYYSFRFTVKPGLCGWAQVHYQYGASTEDAIEKLKYDLYYIKNMSLQLDFFIVIKTLKVVLQARST